MHHITSWPCVNAQARPIALFDFCQHDWCTLAHTTSVYECSILFSFCCYCVCCVQLVGDTTVLKKVAHCHLKRLELCGGRTLLSLLSGVKDNCSVTDLIMFGVILLLHTYKKYMSWGAPSPCNVFWFVLT